MSAERMTGDATDHDVRWLYRVGGISGLVLGMAYIIIIPLYAHVGAPPSDGEAWLKYLAGKTTVWWAILGLSVLTDFLFVPVALSLYFALKGINRNAMLLATALVGLFVVLDLAVTWSNFASLLTLGAGYAAASNDAQRAAYVGAASYAAAVLASRLEIVYAIVTLSSGILIIGVVMLKGIFSKTTAYLGLITGVLGVAALSRVTAIIIMNAVFATVWVLLVGYRLFRLGQR
jgi:hypothetical protein